MSPLGVSASTTKKFASPASSRSPRPASNIPVTIASSPITAARPSSLSSAIISMQRLRNFSISASKTQRLIPATIRYSIPDDEERVESLESLIKLLTRASAQRSLKTLHSLISFVKQIKFFRQLSGDLSEEAVAQCCFNMTYQRADRGEFLFKQGDHGSKFYVILEGRVAVFINNQDEVPDSTQVATLTKGDSFGELALLNNKPRAATISCLSESHFAVLDKSDYVRILSKLHEAKMFEKVDFLLSLPMFKNWTRGSTQKLTFYFKERTFVRKQVLCKAGDPATEVFLLRSGEVEVIKELQTKTQLSTYRTPKTQTTCVELAILTTGESIGHEEAINGGVHQFTYLCRSSSARVMSISREDFLKRVNTEEAWNVFRALAAVKGGMRQQRMVNLEAMSHLKQEGTHSRADSTLTQSQDGAVGSPRLVQTPNPASLLPSPGASPILKKRPIVHDSMMRLYPFRQTVRDSGPQHRSTAIKNFRRMKSWDVIFERKSIDIKKKSGKKNLHSVVNIHTQRMKTAQEGKDYLALWEKSQSGGVQSPKDSTSTSSKPCLTINSIEVVNVTCKDEAPPSPKLDRMISSSHSRFRLKRYSNSSSLPKFDDL